MSESNPTESERGLKDPVRIVYHAGNRTFARIFNERSLEEVKDVVRRKLGLGSQTDVSLKQMGHDTLLDLDDDDDFQAFRVLLRSCVSVDIRVTVGESQGSPVSAPTARKSGEHASTSKTTLPVSPSKEPVGVKALGQSTAQPEVSRTAVASSTPAKTPEPAKRKRKVSFDEAGVAASDKAAAASAKTAGPEDPPKKKQKKESTKTKAKTTDTQTVRAAESPATKAAAPKPKPKKSAALDPGNNVEKSVPKAAETSESPEKKQKKAAKNGSTRSRKTSASGNHDGTDRQSKSAEVASLQPEKPTVSGKEGDTLKLLQTDWTKAPKGMVCASIPQTSASTTVQSEVAAAIVSGFLTQASKAIPLEPSTKRKSVKRDTKKPASSSALPAEPATVLDAPDDELPGVPTEQRLEQVALTNKLQASDLNGPSCPICLETPFHIRYCCPTVLKGPDAIRERLEEIRNTNKGDQQSLIKQLEGLLRDPKVMSGPLSDSTSTDGLQSRTTSPSPSASLLKTPNIPSNSYLSEVTVESKDEGSSSESSDDTSEGEVEQRAERDLSGRKHKTPNKEPMMANGNLQAIVRGPTSKRQSILHLLDRIAGEEDEKDSDSAEDKAELEEDPDDETGRSRHLSYRRITRSSDSESEEESESPSRSVEEEPAEHLQGDVVMKHSVELPVVDGQDDDSSEETHVGSGDRVVIDESTGEKEVKGATIVAEDSDELSPLPRPLEAPCDEPQGSAETGSCISPNRHARVPAAPQEVAIDPIEPADDLAPAAAPPSSIADPIEAPPDDIGSLFAGAPLRTPKPGVSKRLRTRNGLIPDDEADRPVLLGQLALEATDAATPIAPNGKSHKKGAETPVSQEPATRRKGSRGSSVPPLTSTPIVPLNCMSKSGARTRKTTKTPAKQSEERSEALKSTSKGDTMWNGARLQAAPSLVGWEAFAESSSSPSGLLDDPSMLLDELMSSSPDLDDNPSYGRPNGKEKHGEPSKAASSRQAGSSQRKERLFDLSSSQIPFPYSQNQTHPAVAAVLEERGESTDSENEPKVVKKMKTPAPFRTLSQLASQASTFAPTLPTPSKSATNGKAKKRAVEEEESSSSSSDSDEANGSVHIPLNRRAGSLLEKRKKKKGLLSSL